MSALLNANALDIRQRLCAVQPFPPSFRISAAKIRHIQLVVARAYGTTDEALRRHDNHPDVVRPRQIAIYLARELAGVSLPRIGRQFGARHHTTVLYSWRQIRKRVLQEPHFASEIAGLTQIITDNQPIADLPRLQLMTPTQATLARIEEKLDDTRGDIQGRVVRARSPTATGRFCRCWTTTLEQ